MLRRSWVSSCLNHRYANFSQQKDTGGCRGRRNGSTTTAQGSCGVLSQENLQTKHFVFGWLAENSNTECILLLLYHSSTPMNVNHPLPLESQRSDLLWKRWDGIRMGSRISEVTINIIYLIQAHARSQYQNTVFFKIPSEHLQIPKQLAQYFEPHVK